MQGLAGCAHMRVDRGHLTRPMAAWHPDRRGAGGLCEQRRTAGEAASRSSAAPHPADQRRATEEGH
eukprot:354157-Chlamydomonas_euryale.AAC.2